LRKPWVDLLSGFPVEDAWSILGKDSGDNPAKKATEQIRNTISSTSPHGKTAQPLNPNSPISSVD
jgi:hypothetical protein